MDNKGQILQELIDGDNFLIMAHINPDGDSLGSTIGLALALKKMNKSVIMVNADPVPEIYSFLPDIQEIMAVEEVKSHFSTAIVLDCSDLGRLGKAKELLDRCKRVINIDHHITNEQFGKLNYVITDAAATGEIIYNLLTGLPVVIDQQIANALYTALMTDTGGFRHSNTTVNCFKMATELTEKGADPHYVAENIYQSFSYNSLQLLGKLLSLVERSPCGRVAWVEIDQDILRETGCTMDETEGVISYLIGIRGVEVAILFKEIEENKSKVSFRARGKVDVSKVASNFGGGGHMKAAGCWLEESMPLTQAKVLQEVMKALTI